MQNKDKKQKGKFIVFEGIDGCGKSTQFFLLAEHIFCKNKFNNVFITREPYKLKEIRKILREDDNPYKQAEKLTSLFVDDREQHIKEVIKPTLNNGSVVISDRYKLSTIIYQSTQGIQIQKLIDLHKKMPIPDITFIIDLPAEIAKQRMKDKGADSEKKFEKSVEFQELLRKAYLKIPKVLENEKIFVIDGNNSVNEIHETIKRIYDTEFDED
jgi:dTMP kinase